MFGLQQLEQLAANLRALGARRLSILAGAGLLVFSLVGAGSYFLSLPDYETLYTGLSAQDVSRIGAALREAGVDFDVNSEGSKVLVRRGTAPQARMLLAEKGLPNSSTAGYELFDKLGPMGLTSFMQEVTRLRVLEGEIARTIQTMKGIKAARVHLVLPEAGAGRRNRQQPAASVVIRSDQEHGSLSAQAIRHLVASAVPGLTSDQVTIISSDGTVLSSGSDPNSTNAGKMLDIEKTVAAEIRDNVRRTLTPYLGLGNFELSVSARLNLDRKQTNETNFDPESKSERSLRVVKELGSSQNSQNRNAVSVEQNIPAETPGTGAADQSRKSNERREELTNYELNSRTTATVSEGYRIENVTVALVLNKKQLLTAAGEPQGADALERQIKEIERLVATSAGLDLRRGDRVAVTAVDFLAAKLEPLSAPGLAEIVAQQTGSIVRALAAVAAVLLLVWFGLRPLTQVLQQAPPGISNGPATGQLSVQPNGQGLAAGDAGYDAIEAAGAALLPRPGAKNADVQKRLEVALDGNEDQVAAILKQWLREA